MVVQRAVAVLVGGGDGFVGGGNPVCCMSSIFCFSKNFAFVVREWDFAPQKDTRQQKQQ